MYFDRYESRIGRILLVGTEDGLSQLCIENGTRELKVLDGWQHKPDLFSEVKQQLDEYFTGTRTSFDLKLDPQGTVFQKQVWHALTQIPYAKTASYKQIAQRVGNEKASRAVGMANNKNPLPIIVPCHRVIGSNKKLTGYAFGVEIKQQLLDLELINSVFAMLAQHFGEFSWWQSESPYHVMVGAVLTQNTNWGNVDKALTNLGQQLDPERILHMPQAELAELIRPSGYYNQKAIKLQALTQWYKNYSFDIQKVRSESLLTLREQLLAIKGIGGETADAILVYALHKPSFVIDAYTRRIFSRIGLDVPLKYDDFRLKIESSITRDYKSYAYLHGLMVEHAKTFCTKSSPRCDACPLRTICHFVMT